MRTSVYILIPALALFNWGATALASPTVAPVSLARDYDHEAVPASYRQDIHGVRQVKNPDYDSGASGGAQPAASPASTPVAAPAPVARDYHHEAVPEVSHQRDHDARQVKNADYGSDPSGGAPPAASPTSSPQSPPQSGKQGKRQEADPPVDSEPTDESAEEAESKRAEPKGKHFGHAGVNKFQTDIPPTRREDELKPITITSGSSTNGVPDERKAYPKEGNGSEVDLPPTYGNQPSSGSKVAVNPKKAEDLVYN